jgi:hypothetical protein
MIQQGLIERQKHDLLFYQDPVPIRITYKGTTVVFGDGLTHANNQTYFMQTSRKTHTNFTQTFLFRFAYFCRHIIVHLIIYCGNVFRLFSNDDKLPKPVLRILFALNEDRF